MNIVGPHSNIDIKAQLLARDVPESIGKMPKM